MPLEGAPDVIRVFVVDDHAVVRSGVRAEIGDARRGRGRGRRRRRRRSPAIRALRPDVVLLDVHLPGGGGRAVLDGGRAPSYPQVRFLALSVSDAAEDVIAVIRGGARGYVTKAISGAELCEAIRRVHDGDAVLLAPAGRLRARRVPRRRPGRGSTPSSTSSPAASATCCA